MVYRGSLSNAKACPSPNVIRFHRNIRMSHFKLALHALKTDAHAVRGNGRRLLKKEKTGVSFATDHLNLPPFTQTTRVRQLIIIGK